MIISTRKMVEGQPLKYSYSPKQDRFQFFRPFETASNMDRQEELMMPASPASTQSDSDNSISSVEISPSRIRLSNANIIKPEVQCRWRNCGIYFSSLDQLATHVAKVHSASGLGGLFYCGWDGCPRNDKGFNARYKMLVHVRTHTNEKPHKCPTCNKSFSRAENLKIHSRSHSGEKPYVCPVPGCNKAYSNSSDRFKHTRTHQVEKPYHCKVPGCPKKYTDPSSLRKHVKTYKHFVNENEEKVISMENVEDSNKTDGLSCNRLCCVPNGFQLPFSGFLDLKTEENHGFTFVSPYAEKSMIYSAQSMDLDTPLDLSIHRRNF